MSLNENLRRARREKNDEFYTQLPDIEKELRHYTRHFRGKVVYCNCDDPRVSNFFHYFSYKYSFTGWYGPTVTIEARRIRSHTEVAVTDVTFRYGSPSPPARCRGGSRTHRRRSVG